MKPIILPLLISLAILMPMLSALDASKSEQVTFLPITPKGHPLMGLSDESPYNEHYQTTMNVFDPNGNIKTIFVNNSMLNKAQPDLCDFRDRHTYKLCEHLDCDFCMASPHCGTNHFLFIITLYFFKDGVPAQTNASQDILHMAKNVLMIA